MSGDADRMPRGAGTRPTGRSGSYSALLRARGAPAFLAATMIGRLPLAMHAVGAVFLVEGVRGSYLLAGVVTASFTLAAAVAQPVVARLADRRGQTSVALVAGAVYLPSLLAAVVGAGTSLPAAPLVLLAALAGAAYPPFGSFSRVRWSRLVAGRQWDRALSLESVLDEVAFVTGPPLAAALAVLVAPQAPLLVAAGLTVTGVLGLLAAGGGDPVPGVQAVAGGRGAGDGRDRVVTRRGVAPLLAALAFMGVVFGGVEVAVIAFTQERGVPGAAGVVLGLFAGASLVAGVLYGLPAWRRGPAVRFAVTGAGFGLAALLLPVPAGVGGLTAVLVLLGAAVAPTLIAANALVAQLVGEEALTEGFAWVGVAVLVGVATGAAAAGIVIEASGPRAAFAVLSGSGLATALVAALVARMRPASGTARLPTGKPMGRL